MSDHATAERLAVGICGADSTAAETTAGSTTTEDSYTKTSNDCTAASKRNEREGEAIRKRRLHLGSQAVAFGRNYFHALSGTDQIELIPPEQQQKQPTTPTSTEDSNNNNNNGGKLLPCIPLYAQYWEEPPWRDKTKNNNDQDEIKQVVCSAQSTVFLTDAGQLFQTGTVHGCLYTEPVPITIPLPVKCVQIAAGRHFMLGMMEAGLAVVSWGAGHFGQLGYSVTTGRSSEDQQHHQVTFAARPVVMERLLPHVIGSPMASVAAGDWHGLALTKSGRVWAWGSNRSLQCGRKPARSGSSSSATTATAPTLLTPLPVPLDVPICKITAGKSHSVALTQNGAKVYCWGSCIYGQCGAPVRRSTGIAPPILVQGLADKEIIDIAAGANHTLAVTEKGKVYAWGCGLEGQLGLGPAVTAQVKPSRVIELDFSATAAGQKRWKSRPQEKQSLPAVSGDGDQAHGAIAEDLSASASSTATIMEDDVRITNVFAADSYSVALANTGHVYAWGSNDAGQLGLATPHQDCLPIRDNSPTSASAKNVHNIKVSSMSSSIGSNKSLRDLHVRTFDSRHNVLLPVRLDAVASMMPMGVRTIACGPNHMWCIGRKNKATAVNGTDMNSASYCPQYKVGRTLYEVQEEELKNDLRRSSKTSIPPAPGAANLDNTVFDDLDHKSRAMWTSKTLKLEGTPASTPDMVTEVITSTIRNPPKTLPAVGQPHVTVTPMTEREEDSICTLPSMRSQPPVTPPGPPKGTQKIVVDNDGIAATSTRPSSPPSTSSSGNVPHASGKSKKRNFIKRLLRRRSAGTGGDVATLEPPSATSTIMQSEEVKPSKSRRSRSMR